MPNRQRRTRGSARAAKKLQRQLEAESRICVYPGLSGGTFKPLSEHDMSQIHEAVLTVLERVGLAEPVAEMAQLAEARGGFFNANGRLCFPRSRVKAVCKLSVRRPNIVLLELSFQMSS